MCEPTSALEILYPNNYIHGKSIFTIVFFNLGKNVSL